MNTTNAQLRSRRLTIALTPEEYVALEVVAEARSVERYGRPAPSLVLREMTPAQAVEEYHRLRQRLGSRLVGTEDAPDRLDPTQEVPGGTIRDVG